MSDKLDSTGDLCEPDFALLLQVHNTKIKPDQVSQKIPPLFLLRFLDLVDSGYISDSGPVIKLTAKGDRALSQWSYIQKWKDRKSYKQGFMSGLFSGLAASVLIWLFGTILKMLTA